MLHTVALGLTSLKMSSMFVRNMRFYSVVKRFDLTTSMGDVIKINVNKMDKYGNTALHNAIKKNDVNTVKFLLSNNACVFKKNSQGDNVYDIINKTKNFEMLKVLAKYNNNNKN
jgi:hypothetical protein